MMATTLSIAEDHRGYFRDGAARTVDRDRDGAVCTEDRRGYYRDRDGAARMDFRDGYFRDGAARTEDSNRDGAVCTEKTVALS
jgi:hypothetical protein